MVHITLAVSLAISVTQVEVAQVEMTALSLYDQSIITSLRHYELLRILIQWYTFQPGFKA